MYHLVDLQLPTLASRASRAHLHHRHYRHLRGTIPIFHRLTPRKVVDIRRAHVSMNQPGEIVRREGIALRFRGQVSYLSENEAGGLMNCRQSLHRKLVSGVEECIVIFRKALWLHGVIDEL